VLLQTLRRLGIAFWDSTKWESSFIDAVESPATSEAAGRGDSNGLVPSYIKEEITMPITRYPEYQYDDNIAGIPSDTNIDSGILTYRLVCSTNTDGYGYSTNLNSYRYITRKAMSASTTSFLTSELAGKST
jgi:hypothetical protein